MNKVIAIGKYMNKEVMVMKAEWWYDSKLQRYFDKHYGAYDETAEYYVNPAPNIWLFDIPELGMTIELTCDDKGLITERCEPMSRK